MAEKNLKIKIFADGADIKGMLEQATNPLVTGFTTNPTLMRQAGITDYKGFALQVLKAIPDRPVSFEVFADDFPTMLEQGREIASWGSNVYVKVPVTNTKGEFAGALISQLSKDGVKLNVTAVMTNAQVQAITDALNEKVPAIISVFAGRIADTGRDPVPLMTEALGIMKSKPKAELLWASPRELLNIFQADEIGCHVITVTNDLIKKLALAGKDLDEYSRQEAFCRYGRCQCRLADCCGGDSCGSWLAPAVFAVRQQVSGGGGGSRLPAGGLPVARTVRPRQRQPLPIRLQAPGCCAVHPLGRFSRQCDRARSCTVGRFAPAQRHFSCSAWLRSTARYDHFRISRMQPQQ